jgi:predicted GH43/DUF377 family glycosyl hydrolase
MAGPELVGIVLSFVALALACLALVLYWLAWMRRPLRLNRLVQNPVLSPDPTRWWETEAVFNPGAVYHDGRVHLFYRALGRDGISRIGYASSRDGIHFERSPQPAYDPGVGIAVPDPMPGKKVSYRPLSYNTDLYASGGGWGGSEDPRAVIIDERCYVTFGIFENWQSMRLAVTSLMLPDLSAALWRWQPHIPMSAKNETHKNWVLFPEKINGKFAILHAMTPTIAVKYVDDLETLRHNPIKSNNRRGGREGKWDAFVRGASAPPIKTGEGWLLLYHGMTPHAGHGYNVGAMLLDLADPTKILYRSAHPVLVPEAWYEHDWKPGVVYASGAVVIGSDLVVYYGGGDKHIAAAKAPLKEFLSKLMTGDHAVLEKVRV